jgi:Ca2+-binding RTX toxin-like protein
VITLADNDQFTPIDGTPSADTLIGTTGNDLITGGNDSDILTGNGGNDRFIYNDFDDVGDVITDFGATAGGEQDLIDFSQLLNRLGLSNSNPIGDGLVTFTPFSGSTTVNLDRHGIGNPRPYLLLQGVSESNVDSSDFAFS